MIFLARPIDLGLAEFGEAGFWVYRLLLCWLHGSNCTFFGLELGVISHSEGRRLAKESEA